MFVTQALSVVSIVLGLYIIGVFIKDRQATLIQRTPEYHLGCFLVEHNVSHSQSLARKISQLEAKAHKQAPSKSLVGEDYLKKQGLQVAHNFQNFIDDYLTYKEKMRSHVEFAKATTKAYNQYKKCSNIIAESLDFSESDCTNMWDEYQKCFIGLEQLKSNFNVKLGDKDKLQLKIGDLLGKKGVNGVHPSGRAAEIERQYRIKDRELQDTESQYETKLRLVGQKVSNFEYNLIVLQNNTQFAQNMYDECHNHIAEFRVCEELSSEVRSLGHSSIESMEQKVFKKRLALTKIQQMLADSQGEQASRELQHHYNRGLMEYKKLHKLFAEMKARMDRHCGCSESEEKKLKLSLDNALSQQETLKKQLKGVEMEYKEAKIDYENIRSERQKLIAKLSEDLKKASHEKQEEINLMELIKNLEDEDKGIENDLLTYEKEFHSHQFKCNQIKDNLSLKLPQINAVNECLNKKIFYESMKSKLDKSKTGNAIMNEDSKEKLRESLISFLL